MAGADAATGYSGKYFTELVCVDVGRVKIDNLDDPKSRLRTGADARGARIGMEFQSHDRPSEEFTIRRR